MSKVFKNFCIGLAVGCLIALVFIVREYKHRIDNLEQQLSSKRGEE